METWDDYRLAWYRHPWLLVYAIIVVIVFVGAVVGTFIGGPFAILFIPSLGGAYLHHLMVAKQLQRDAD